MIEKDSILDGQKLQRFLAILDSPLAQGQFLEENYDTTYFYGEAVSYLKNARPDFVGGG